MCIGCDDMLMLPTGEPGDTGNGWSVGNGAPTTAPTGGQVFYMDADTGNIYQYSGGTWALIGTLAGPTGATGVGTQGGYGGLSLHFHWLLYPAAAPGAGYMGADDPQLSAAGFLLVSETDADAASSIAFMGLLSSSTSTIKSYIKLFKETDPSEYQIFQFVNIVDSGSFRTIEVTPISGTNSTPATGEDWVMTILMVGDKGTTGLTGANGAAGAAGSNGADGADAAQTYGTSTDNETIPTGGIGATRTFTTQAGLAFLVGSRVIAASAAAPTTKWMEGIVTAYAGTSLTLTVYNSQGVGGSANDWNISFIGLPNSNAVTAPQTISFKLSAADLATINSIPVEILPAPGAGYYYNVISAIAFIDYLAPTMVFAGADELYITVAQPVYSFQNSFLLAAADRVDTGEKLANVPITLTNRAMELESSLADPTTPGGSDIYLHIVYQVLPITF